MRLALLALSMVSLSACEGPAGPAGAAGPQGEPGVEGEGGPQGPDGEDGEDGADGSAFASGSLAPGEFLALEHGLGDGDKHYAAQFAWDGVLYDHSDYPTLLPAHMGEGWRVEDDALGAFYDDITAARLAAGDLVVFYQGDLASTGDELLTGAIVSPTGDIVAALPDYVYTNVGGSFWEYNDPAVAATADGGFVVVVLKEGTDGGAYIEGALVDRYDATGTLLSSEDIAPTGFEIDSVQVEALPAGGFVVGFGGYDDDAGEDAVGVRAYDASGVGSNAGIIRADGGDLRMAVLPDERVALLVERSGAEFDAIDVVILQDDGTVASETRLQESYLTDDSAIVYGSQGTLLVAAESGGPDLPFFAVLDTDGAFVQPPTGMSGWENDVIEAGAFPDGDFLVVVTEDDSYAPMTWVVGGQGGLLRPMVVGDIAGVPGYYRGAFVSTGDDHTLGFVDPSYTEDLGPRYSVYTKGLLQLRVESDDEVRLYNQTPSTLDVTLVAHRAP